MDKDYAEISSATPEYYWLCRNESEPAFNTSGKLSDIPLVSLPDVVQDYSSVNASEV